MDFCIISAAELDFIPSTRLGFRRAVPEFLRRPFAFVVADRVIKSGLKSQSNPPTMRRMRATICESRRGDRRTACNTCSVELIRDPAVVEICRITIAIVNYGILLKCDQNASPLRGKLQLKCDINRMSVFRWSINPI